MDEYLAINWRENLLTDNTYFFTQQDYVSSNMHQSLTGTLNIKSIRKQFDVLHRRCGGNDDYPGKKYYSQYIGPKCKTSQFNSIEHQRFINALKVQKSGRLNLNRFELGDKELFNNCQADILKENKRFLKMAEDNWKFVCKRGIQMNDSLYKFAFTERMHKLKDILKLPQFYTPADSLPWNDSETDIDIEMMHIANTHDLGAVSQYMPPLLEEPCILDAKLLPTSTNNNYYSKLPISEDKNIESFLLTGEADVAISLSALKRILHYTDTNQVWTIPLVIKNVTLPNGNTKQLLLFDKPLLKQTISKVDLNLRCHKLLVRSNFCPVEGFRYDCTDKLIDEGIEESSDDRILHNVAYKLWVLREKQVENSRMFKRRSSKSFKVLVRTKNDACRPCEGGLQAVTIVPKMEYQLKYGANVFTEQEIMSQWTDLTFRPASVLQRVRTHYCTSEVVKIEEANLEQISKEAAHQQINPRQALVVLYKLLLGMAYHNEGKYLLRHEPKHGKFVTLLKEATDSFAPSIFDLHEEYSSHTKIVDPYLKPWTPIDTNVILPAFENHGHFPGLLKPSPYKKKVFRKPDNKDTCKTRSQSKMNSRILRSQDIGCV